MSRNTIAEYRNLYKNRHGIECPLSDAQIRTAMANTSPATLEDEWPLQLDVLTEMESLVTSEFPAVDQGRWQMAGTLLAPQNLAVDNATAEGFDVNFSLPTGGNTPYSIQLQIAPDDTGAPGTWADEGEAQDDATEIVVTGLTDTTAYWARVKVTDNLGEIDYSNEETITTSAP